MWLCSPASAFIFVDMSFLPAGVKSGLLPVYVLQWMVWMKNEVLVCASGFSVNLETEFTHFFRETARSKTFSFSLIILFVKIMLLSTRWMCSAKSLKPLVLWYVGLRFSTFHHFYNYCFEVVQHLHKVRCCTLLVKKQHCKCISVSQNPRLLYSTVYSPLL